MLEDSSATTSSHHKPPPPPPTLATPVVDGKKHLNARTLALKLLGCKQELVSAILSNIFLLSRSTTGKVVLSNIHPSPKEGT